MTKLDTMNDIEKRAREYAIELIAAEFDVAAEFLDAMAAINPNHSKRDGIKCSSNFLKFKAQTWRDALIEKCPKKTKKSAKRKR